MGSMCEHVGGSFIREGIFSCSERRTPVGIGLRASQALRLFLNEMRMDLEEKKKRYENQYCESVRKDWSGFTRRLPEHTQAFAGVKLCS